jgi:thioredoxin reductase
VTLGEVNIDRRGTNGTDGDRHRRPTASDNARRDGDCEVAIIGAGPYGLSAAAHLKAAGVSVCVYGEPMKFWAKNMPAGMLLRSPRDASNLSDPEARLSLERYEAASQTPATAPVPIETFVAYGRWFNQQSAPEMDPRGVDAIRTAPNGFVLRLDDGEERRFERVVVAAGIGSFMRKPDVFGRLDPAMASHCYEGRSPREFSGKRVVVIGAGQSALESAALLHEAGAEVEVISRIPALRWIGMHPWLHKMGPLSALLYSKFDVGPAGISRLVAMPSVVRHVPLGIRDKIRTRAVRSAGSRWLPPRLERVKLTTGRSIVDAGASEHRVKLKLDDGSERTADHVLMGTGYSVDLARYRFMPAELLSRIRVDGGYPVLTSGFSTSLPGLHIIGAPAARSFGPLMYFVAGTEFTSGELVSGVLRDRRRSRQQTA